jgi:hypothetical protein
VSIAGVILLTVRSGISGWSGGILSWRHMNMSLGVQILYGTVVYLDLNIVRD